MSRSNLPPNGWPGQPLDPVYQDPHAPRHPQHNPQASQQPQTAGRPPRIQQAPGQHPGYAPQHPGYAPPSQGYAPQPQPPQPRVPEVGLSPPPSLDTGSYYAPPGQPAYAPPPQRPAQPHPQQAYTPAHPASQFPNSVYAAVDRPAPPQPDRKPPSNAPFPGLQAYVPEPPTQRPSQRPVHVPAAAPHHPHPADGWAQPPMADASQFDLGTYMPHDTAAAPQRSAAPAAPRGQAPAFAPARGPSPDPYAAYQPPGLAQPLPASAAPAETYDDELYDDEVEEAEPPRKVRYGLIAASFVAALAGGGGLAYAYKTFFAAPAQVGQAPLVKNAGQPMKVKPADPGGTKFANSDSKLMNRMEDGGSSDAATSPADGPRAVRTLPVGRDGSIGGSPQQAAAVAPPQQPPPTTTVQPVPGMTLVLPQAQAPAPSPPPAAPARLAAAPPPAPPVEAAIDAPVPAKKPVAPAKKAVAPPAALGAGGSGFVTVLASVPASASSRNQAMAQFAELQQRYSQVLASKSPDVVEAKLEKGTYHRLIVGPPASRDAANSVCGQLKAAGYTADCWVTAF